jgi:hypothetical protein
VKSVGSITSIFTSKNDNLVYGCFRRYEGKVSKLLPFTNL